MNSNKYLLKMGGKIVTVRDFDEEMQMCAIECPNERIDDHVVHITEREKGQTKQMAFCFPCGNHFYYPMVDGNKLKISNVSDDLTDSYWFVRENHVSGNWYNLRSLVKPIYCLSVLHQRPYTFSLSDSKPVQIKAEKV